MEWLSKGDLGGGGQQKNIQKEEKKCLNKKK